MAPGRATGTSAHARYHIWAFGVVLSEMLTGQSGFGGKTTIEVLSNGLKAEPDWTALPPRRHQLCAHSCGAVCGAPL
jgi:serine/threonine protein kinase